MEKDTKRFLLKGAEFASIFILASILFSLYLEIFPMNYFQQAYPIWSYQFDIIDGNIPADDARILIFGDSRAMAGIIPEIIGNDTRSLALGGATPIETYFILQRYLQTHSAPAIILLSFAPQHLQKSFTFWDRTVKFGFFDKNSIAEIYKTAKLNKDFPMEKETSFWVEYYLIKFRFLPLYAPELRESIFFLEHNANKAKYDEMMHFRGHTPFGNLQMDDETIAKSYEAENPRFSASKTLVNYTVRIANLCKENNITIVYFTMPFSEFSFSFLNESYFKEYNTLMGQIVMAAPGNSFMGKIPVYENRHFTDSSHLNGAGAVKFSNELKGILARQGLDPV
ncbi:MAG TPA: hypothetical protein HA362_00725 [Nanoarchaeota archaeon]|nr:hypothetical protein [Nanoarchaeota archaeon]